MYQCFFTNTNACFIVICRLCSLMEDFLYSAKIRQSILMSYFTRYLQRMVKFWQRRKSEKLILLLNCKSRVDLQCPEYTVFKNLCSLRMLKRAGCEEVCTNLFETSKTWQVFKVSVSSKPQKVSCRKRLHRSKKDYQGQILVNYSCHGWTFL